MLFGGEVTGASLVAYFEACEREREREREREACLAGRERVSEIFEYGKREQERGEINTDC